MSEENTNEGRRIDRRTVVKGAAWSVPVIAAAAAVPMAAASGTPQVASLDIDAGCIQVAGLQVLPGFSVKNKGGAAYQGAVSGPISVVETIDLSAITTPLGDILGSTVRTALWAILLTEGILSGATAGVVRGSWQSGGGLVPKVYTRTVSYAGDIAAGGQIAWGTLFDLTKIISVLDIFGLETIKRSARITTPTGTVVADAGPSVLDWNLVGGC